MGLRSSMSRSVLLMSSAVWSEIVQARLAAHKKHGDQSIEAAAAGDPRWLPILVEEVGEVAHELTYDAAGSVRAELIDVLAVASAWVDALDRRRAVSEWLADRADVVTKHVVRQAVPWTPFLDADYMLTRGECSCGWTTADFVDQRGNKDLDFMFNEMQQHDAEENGQQLDDIRRGV